MGISNIPKEWIVNLITSPMMQRSVDFWRREPPFHKVSVGFGDAMYIIYWDGVSIEGSTYGEFDNCEEFVDELPKRISKQVIDMIFPDDETFPVFALVAGRARVKR